MTQIVYRDPTYKFFHGFGKSKEKLHFLWALLNLNSVFVYFFKGEQTQWTLVF